MTGEPWLILLPFSAPSSGSLRKCASACVKSTANAEAVGDGASGDIGSVGERFELVWHAGSEVELDGHPRSAEALGVGKALIAEDVDEPRQYPPHRCS